MNDSTCILGQNLQSSRAICLRIISWPSKTWQLSGIATTSVQRLFIYWEISVPVSEECILEWDGPKGSKPTLPLLKDMFASERRKAKVLNFSIAYGKTAHGLSKDWNVSLEEAQETVNKWYADRPEVSFSNLIYHSPYLPKSSLVVLNTIVSTSMLVLVRQSAKILHCYKDCNERSRHSSRYTTASETSYKRLHWLAYLLYLLSAVIMHWGKDLNCDQNLTLRQESCAFHLTCHRRTFSWVSHPGLQGFGLQCCCITT